MASKKYTLLLGALCFFLTNVSAQSYDWKDSSLIPKKGQAQHSEFLQNQNAFPAKPRNQWEIGLSVGNSLISGDVYAKIPQIGWGAHVRKAFGYIFSARVQYIGGIAKGMNFTPAYNYAKNPAFGPYYDAPQNISVTILFLPLRCPPLYFVCIAHSLFTKMKRPCSGGEGRMGHVGRRET